jgi:hypothetical protein
MVVNFLPGGALGPFGAYPSSGLGIPIGAPLVGLAVDDASPFGPGHLYASSRRTRRACSGGSSG